MYLIVNTADRVIRCNFADEADVMTGNDTVASILAHAAVAIIDADHTGLCGSSLQALLNLTSAFAELAGLQQYENHQTGEFLTGIAFVSDVDPEELDGMSAERQSDYLTDCLALSTI